MTLAEHKLLYPHKNFEELLEKVECVKPFKAITLSVVDCSDTDQLTKLMIEVYDSKYRELFSYPVKALEATTLEASEANFEVLLPIMQTFLSFLNSRGIQKVELWDELVTNN